MGLLKMSSVVFGQNFMFANYLKLDRFEKKIKRFHNQLCDTENFQNFNDRQGKRAGPTAMTLNG